ncbi:MAG: aspartyl-tRNA amidotransferase subunit B [Bacteroidetes bacterium OLB11]|nr:MAG: aspartyl-tRNA amidotransferase subunit B [Bacteroidetes bacterium OLB11]
MPLENKINEEIKAAMLAKKEAELRALRAIKSAILLAKTADGQQGDLTHEDETKLLQKLAKQRKDSIEIFTKQNREDLAKKEIEELDVIQRFFTHTFERRRIERRIEKNHRKPWSKLCSRNGKSNGRS